MTSDKFIGYMKENFKTAEDWAIAEKNRHFESVKEGVIEFVNENFIKELVTCTTWDQAEDIVQRYVLGD